MDKSRTCIVCVLFLTGILWACGPATSSPPAQEASITPAAATDLQATSLPVPSPTSESSPAPQENPTLTPTVFLPTNSTRRPNANLPLCNDSLFLEDVTIPDMSILRPGEHFRKTWKFKNTGTCEWTTSYAIGFSHGEALGGRDTKLTRSVAPGASADVSVDMTAPDVNGWYGGFWRLKSDTGNYFGDFVYVSIVVSDGSETSTPFLY